MCDTHFNFDQTDLLPQFIQDVKTNTTATIRIYKRGTPEYEALIKHHFENGIKEVTPYVLEPCSEADVITLIRILKSGKMAFAIKSGGHISIPKIYPPDGYLISLNKFTEITYDKDTKTLNVGAGLTWENVYNFLEKHHPNLGVVGANPAVGVSGFLLGGGYSLLTNKHGLGMDNVVGFRVVTPHGPNGPTILDANPRENPDLFKALKGGGHNFGIVTRFTLRTHQDEAWQKPSVKEFGEDMSSKIKAYLVKLIQEENKSPPEATFRHLYKDNKKTFSIILAGFYGDIDFQGGSDLVQFFFGDGYESKSIGHAYEAFALRHLPVPLETLQNSNGEAEFAAFDSANETHAKFFKEHDIIEKYIQLSGLSSRPGSAYCVYRKILKTLTDKSDRDSFRPQQQVWEWLLSLVYRKIFKTLTDKTDRDSFNHFKAGRKTLILEDEPGLRGRMASILVTTYTLELIDEAERQAKRLGDLLADHNGRRASFELWPFHKDSFKGIKTKDSAWPHEEGKVFGPLVGWFEWIGKENDNFWLTKIRDSLKTLHEVALKEKCTTNDLPLYPNITLETTLAKDIYGVNYNELKEIRKKYDPANVMGQASGFII